MKLTVRADIDLDTTDATKAASAYVTWLDVDVADPVTNARGTARVAIVHVGEITDALGDVAPALQGTALEPIARAYFAEGWYRDEFSDGAGIDLIYVASVEMNDEALARNVDLAMIRRLCDTLGSGCQLAVMPYTSPLDAAHWGRLGFSLTTSGRANGLMHMKLGYRHARIVDSTGSGDYEVLPTVVLHERHTAN